MKGELERGAGIYQVTWEEPQIMVKADRLYEDFRNNTFAEITVRSTIPGLTQHIHQARLNLVSTTTRRNFIKELEQRVADVPWGAIVEEMCILILRAHREGEPFYQMAEYAPGNILGHRLSPLLREKQNTVFFGQGETFKSFISIYLGLLVASGTSATGFDPEPGRVLYLDYESEEDEIWQRLNMLTAGMEPHQPIPEGFFYRYMTQPLASDIEIVQRFVMENEIDLVIVDSAAPASLEPETSAGAGAYFRALRSLQCTTLTIAHTEASGRQDRPFGSIFWRNQPRANFRFRATAHSGDGEGIVGITQTKANKGQRIRPFGLRLRFASDALQIKRADIADIADLSESLPLRDRIAQLLRDGAMTGKALAEELEVTHQVVKNTLSNNRKTFVITSTNGGIPTWGLLQNEAETP